jgi:hypothetical protein
LTPEPSRLLLAKCRVRFPRPRVADVDRAVDGELARQSHLFDGVRSVAIAVGSRGIANLSQIVRTVVSVLRDRGMRPFIVPAMGSHGGATAEGQLQVLADYGVTEQAMGCSVRSSMDVIELDRGDLPFGLFMDRAASEADGILLVNRIKPHTDFRGAYESGLAKMSSIGLGKERQALAIHRFGATGLRDGIPRAAARVLATGKIIGGLGLVENAYDETMVVELVPAGAILSREPELLEIARAHMPRLPVDDIDVLIVDRLGKDISGTGLDTNVIGRMRIAGETEPDRPHIRTIVVSDLTDLSHGNSTGTGLADVVTRRLFDKIDLGVTYTNTYTSGFIERGRIPVVAPTDADAYACALRACGVPAPGTERIARIRDTLHLGEIYLSPPLTAAVEARPDVDLLGPPSAMFDEAGALTPF